MEKAKVIMTKTKKARTKRAKGKENVMKIVNT